MLAEILVGHVFDHDVDQRVEDAGNAAEQRAA